MGTRSHEHINKTSAVFDHLRSSNHDADNFNFKILVVMISIKVEK